MKLAAILLGLGAITAHASDPGEGTSTAVAYPSIKSGFIHVAGDSAKVLWDMLSDAPEEFYDEAKGDLRRTGQHIQCSRFPNVSVPAEFAYTCWTYIDSTGAANVMHPAERGGQK